jgi:ribosomal protein S18 acetylase RimI-like enzyme
MNIRPATLDDADLLAVLNADVQRLHADALPQLFKQPDDLGMIAAAFRDVFFPDPNVCVFIVEVEGAAAGYVVARISHRPENAFTYAQDWIYIDQIGVRPAYQGQGCGRMLVQAVFELAQAEKINRITLDTWAFNTEAQAFFKKQRFEVSIYRMDVYLEG